MQEGRYRKRGKDSGGRRQGSGNIYWKRNQAVEAGEGRAATRIPHAYCVPCVTILPPHICTGVSIILILQVRRLRLKSLETHSRSDGKNEGEQAL